MAANVRRVRHSKDLTQEELAGRAGLSPRYIGSIERGQVSASVTVLGQIANALSVDATELVKALSERKMHSASRKPDEADDKTAKR